MATEDNQPSSISRGNTASGPTSPPPPPTQIPSTHQRQSQYTAPPASTFFGGEGRPSVESAQGAVPASTTVAAKTFKVSQAHLPQHPSKGSGGLSTTLSGVQSSGHSFSTHPNAQVHPNPNPNPNPNLATWFTGEPGPGAATGSAGEFFGSLSAADMTVPETPAAADYEGLDDRLSTASASLSALDFGTANACPRCRRPAEGGAHFCNQCGYQLGNLDAPSAEDGPRDDASPMPKDVSSGFGTYSGETSFVDTRFGHSAPMSGAPTAFVLNETPPRHMFHQTMSSIGGHEASEGERAATIESTRETIRPAQDQDQGAPPSHGMGGEGPVDSHHHYYYYNMAMPQSSYPSAAALGDQVPVQPMGSSATLPSASLTQATVPPGHYASSSLYVSGSGGGGGGVPLMRSGTIDSFASSTAIHMTNRSAVNAATTMTGTGPLTSFALPSSSKSMAPAPGTVLTSARSRIPLIQSFRPDTDAAAAAGTELPTATNPSNLTVSPLAAAAAPSATKSMRVHPVFCFGFGGLAFVTFPIKQMRFTMTPTGVSTSSSSPGTGVAYHRPGPLHCVPLSDLPRVQELCIQPIMQCGAGQPLMDQRHVKVKELVAALETLLPTKTADPQGRDALIRLLHLMLTNKEGMGMGEARDEAVRRLLLPDEQRLSLESISSSFSSPPPSQQPSSSRTGSSLGAHAELVKLLLRGDRGNAVMLAVSQHMWPHALLIASHVDRETYCATVGEFARQVLPLGHPLRTMYLLFAEQHALAGAEMQSMAPPSLRRDWLIQLAMIMSNRTPDDHLVIMALGDALRQEGLIYAAHLCYLLCDDAHLISGLEADSTRIVYLGADHERAPHSFFRNWSALRLTEILEFALRQASGGHYVMEHLQAYKLKFAGWLADLGLVSLAMQYCQVIEEVARLAVANKSSPASSCHLRDPVLGAAAKSLHERLARHMGATTATELGSAITGSGWLPKMGGILEAFDRGLTRVIGVSTEEGGPGSGPSPADGTINVMAAVEQEPSGWEGEQDAVPASSQARLPVPHSQMHLVTNEGGEAWSHVENPQQQQSQPWQSSVASSHQRGEVGSVSLMAPTGERGYVQGSFQDQQSSTQYQVSQQQQQYLYNQAGASPTVPAGQSLELVSGPREQVEFWQHSQQASVLAQTSAVPLHSSSTADPVSAPSPYAYDPQQPRPPMAQLQLQQPSQGLPHMPPGQSHQYSMAQYHQGQAQAQTLISEGMPPQVTFPQSHSQSAQPQLQSTPSSAALPLPLPLGQSQSQPTSLSPPALPAPSGSQPPAAPMPRPPSQSPSLGSYSQGSAGQWATSASGPTAAAPSPMNTVQDGGGARERGKREEDDDDDLGFGNLSLSKGTKSVDGGTSDRASSAAGGETGTSAAQSSTAGATTGEKRGVLGLITGWFGRKGANEQNVSGPKQASLGEPSSFRYDEKLKRWVDDKDPSTFEPVAPPPLPLARMKMATVPSPALPLGGDGATAGTGSTAPSGPMAVTASPNDFRRGASRSARSRYVDPFNPQAGSGGEAGAAGAPMVPTSMIPPPIQPVMAPGQLQSSQPPQQLPSQIPMQQHQSEPIPTQNQFTSQQIQSQWQGDVSMQQQQDHSQPSLQPQYQQPHPTDDQAQGHYPPQYYYAAAIPSHQLPPQQHPPPPQEYQQQQPLYYYQQDPNAPSQPLQSQQYTYS